MLAPVRKGIASLLTLLERLHKTLFIFLLRKTSMRPSEFLALRKKDLVPRQVPLLHCWSVVIAASEIGVKSPRWVGPHGPGLASLGLQAPARTQGRKSGGQRSGILITLQQPKMFDTATVSPGLSGILWGQDRSGARFQHSARSAKSKSITPLSPSPTSKTSCKHSRIVQRYC